LHHSIEPGGDEVEFGPLNWLDVGSLLGDDLSVGPVHGSLDT
jgi:hypothetical protein